MRWYVNDASLQGQYPDPANFLSQLRSLAALRAGIDRLRNSLFVAPTLADREVRGGLSLAEFLRQPENRHPKLMLLQWFGRAWPDFEANCMAEEENYFEFAGSDVTDCGLGEAARRVKAHQQAATFSFSGGAIDFARSPLVVDHGLEQDRLGTYEIQNVWTVDDLHEVARKTLPAPTNWRELIETARVLYSRLCLPDAVYLNPALAREGFDSAISDRALALLSYLNRYMDARNLDGSQTAAAQEIVDEFFSGERAVFSPESATNRRKFKEDLTFSDPEDANAKLFCEWHGKISHRSFRLHFEWPMPKGAVKLKVVYLGPKLTKA